MEEQGEIDGRFQISDVRRGVRGIGEFFYFLYKQKCAFGRLFYLQKQTSYHSSDKHYFNEQLVL